MLWTCKESASGGKGKVKWLKVYRSKALSGLGILDLGKFARALGLRWLWFEWVAPPPGKPSLGLAQKLQTMNQIVTSSMRLEGSPLGTDGV
jgi:hypothetical protein